MKFGVRVQWKPPGVLERIKQSPQIVGEELQEALETLRLRATEVATEKAPVDQGPRGGKLRGSLQPGGPKSLTKTTAKQAVVGSRLGYATPLEYGTKPLRASYARLTDWVMRNQGRFGVSDQAEAGRVARVVWKEIATHGVKRHGFLTAGLEAARERAAKVVQQAAERILKRLGLR